MAIIVDPDNLDRVQVIFGTENRKISLYPVGALRHVSSTSSAGQTTSATTNFTDATATFTTWGVTAGDILCIFTKDDAGHYTVASVTSETVLVVETTESFTTFSTTNTAIRYDIRVSSGGSIEDGVTEQCVYSYAKEEWKSDSALYGSDDLIRHEFPFEPITSEQFEIGGGSAHDSWDWFDDFTKKKVRTGGWAKKNTGGTTLQEYTGIVTLGSLDSDTRVYYQQNTTTETPVDFTFLGTVNEPIRIYESGFDRRTYLKLFARKKGRTYAGSQISDIGVSTITTIVNRFPLTHAIDTAITADDAEILGTSTWRNQNLKESGTDGAKSSNGIIFTSAGSTFTSNGVAPGDTLQIQSGTEQGYFTILTVDSETQLTIATDAEFIDWADSETGLTFQVISTYILSGRTDGVLADVDGDTGTLTSATAGLNGGVVAAGDMVIITEAASDHRGVYKVISVDSATQLTLNTSDKPFTSVSNINFDVVEPGMYLQFKEEALTIGATGNLTFANADPDTLARASGSWIDDGVTVGTVIRITATASGNNVKSFTVANVTALTLTFVATDTVTAETTTGTVTAFDTFKRSINGVTYPFRWRLFGRNASAANCYQFIQHQLRQTTDIDYGPATKRGDINDLLMSYQAPNGTALDLIIDDINADDTNNVIYTDATSTNRSFPFVSAGSINFNVNLQNDAAAEYTMFFTNDDAGDNTGRDYGTVNAIIVEDSLSADITGLVSAQSSVSFTYDYDGNVQRGAASAGEDAPVTIVAIGLNTAQFVITTGTITRAKGISFSLVSALERNYSNV